ncbi:Type III secretion pathway protein [gamma proteobacterium HdN1]|nr:Type III secretion pathway protein [gamma proteobacterium HdN1]
MIVKSSNRVVGIVVLVLAVTGMLQDFASAREIPFRPQQAVRYELSSKPLPEFLEEILAENGFRASLSDRLRSDKRTLNGIREGSPDSVFNSIVRSNQLLVFYDGSVVHAYHATELVRRFYPLPSDRVNGFDAALRRLSLDDDTNRTKIDTNANLVEVVGAPLYAEQIYSLLGAIVQKDGGALDFRFISLRYAWASDRTFVVGGRQVTIPGVATVLRDLVQGGNESQRLYALNDVALPTGGESVRRANSGTDKGDAYSGYRGGAGNGGGRGNYSESDSGKLAQGQGGAGVGRHPATLLSEEGISRIVADPQRNAIIIRDKPELMPLYENLVKNLDVPSPVIEIEATIIDVNTDKLREQGVDWGWSNGRTSAMTGEVDAKNNFLEVLAGDAISGLAQNAGMQAGTIIGNRNRFVARLNLLEREGVVKVASRPKVVTLNDLEAVLESSRSVYVPVQGAYDVDLFKVFSGTVLRVTPHVINDVGTKKIRLIISAEDGVIDEHSTNNAPSVTRNAVSTQAVIEGETSLLLGGLSRTESITQVRKVPLLGSIPLLGALFRSEAKVVQNSERLFLITPRLLEDGIGLASVPGGPARDFMESTETR